ncbi:DnaJ-domain-containing protein [Gonapodya prolifera JEL478]|uniref:DnaJ-domain-containing protein n=1 Tax=Gonapodya prolifera (strain JEL478) TaxID=1344416 RepID=A0A139ACM6_GONPJ|nr:DnaJ-domain-containing protein [Gonapodya prolifera JEL478]|eukprot:KXS14163.1 DnaJ-domain-containing protein [Gonapodya prolifera JEL478]
MSDLYAVLEISRDASQDDVRKAYHKQALRWHPDKNPNNREEAEEKFKLVSKAYEVLSDTSRRELYDSHGLESSTRGASARGSTSGAGRPFTTPSFDPFEGFSHFQFHDPFDVFRSFFGGGDPFSDFLFDSELGANSRGFSRPPSLFTSPFAAPFASPFGGLSRGGVDPLASVMGGHGGLFHDQFLGAMLGSSSAGFMSTSSVGGGSFTSTSTSTSVNALGERTMVTTVRDGQGKTTVTTSKVDARGRETKTVSVNGRTIEDSASGRRRMVEIESSPKNGRRSGRSVELQDNEVIDVDVVTSPELLEPTMGLPPRPPVGRTTRTYPSMPQNSSTPSPPLSSTTGTNTYSKVHDEAIYVDDPALLHMLSNLSTQTPQGAAPRQSSGPKSSRNIPGTPNASRTSSHPPSPPIVSPLNHSTTGGLASSLPPSNDPRVRQSTKSHGTPQRPAVVPPQPPSRIYTFSPAKRGSPLTPSPTEERSGQGRYFDDSTSSSTKTQRTPHTTSSNPGQPQHDGFHLPHMHLPHMENPLLGQHSSAESGHTRDGKTPKGKRQKK